jgi:hypothetical protein
MKARHFHESTGPLDDLHIIVRIFVFLNMTTLTIELMDEKALSLLQNLEDLHIIRVIKKPARLSSLRNQIKTKMSNEAIDKQINELRDEWQQDI